MLDADQHEAIYQALCVQGRGALKRELVACLRTGRALRVPRARSRQKAWAYVTPEVMITERPTEVEDRAVPSRWEGGRRPALVDNDLDRLPLRWVVRVSARS